MQISALVIARNEERNISKCLESLKFADETVIILDRSSDKTEEFSKIYTKKFFQVTGYMKVIGETLVSLNVVMNGF